MDWMTISGGLSYTFVLVSMEKAELLVRPCRHCFTYPTGAYAYEIYTYYNHYLALRYQYELVDINIT